MITVMRSTRSVNMLANTGFKPAIKRIAVKAGKAVKNNLVSTVNNLRHPSLIIKDAKKMIKTEGIPFAAYMLAINGVQNIVLPAFALIAGKEKLIALMGVPEELITIPLYIFARYLLRKTIAALSTKTAQCYSGFSIQPSFRSSFAHHDDSFNYQVVRSHFHTGNGSAKEFAET